MWPLKPRYVSCIDHQTLHLPSRPPPSDSELRTNEISHNKTACDRAGPNLRHTCSVKLGPVFFGHAATFFPKLVKPSTLLLRQWFCVPRAQFRTTTGHLLTNWTPADFGVSEESQLVSWGSFYFATFFSPVLFLISCVSYKSAHPSWFDLPWSRGPICGAAALMWTREPGRGTHAGVSFCTRDGRIGAAAGCCTTCSGGRTGGIWEFWRFVICKILSKAFRTLQTLCCSKNVITFHGIRTDNLFDWFSSVRYNRFT